MDVFEKKLILLVEDEVLVAMSEQMDLKRYGYDVILAHSGNEAINTFILNPDIVLIIMDIDLGNGMDGTESAAKILIEKEIPILFMSSHIEPEIVEKTEKITSYGYVVKGSSMTVINASIKMALRLFDAKMSEKAKEEELCAANEQMEASYNQLLGSEHELRESEEKYRALFEKMPSGVGIFKAINGGEDFEFLNFNSAGEKIESVKRKAIIGKTVTKVFPGVEEFGLLNVFRRVWKTGISEDHPISFYNDERLTGWRENFVYKLPSGEIVSIYKDITERKQVEEKLKLSEEQLRNFVDNASDAFFISDMNGNFLDVNESACINLGYTREELLNLSITDIDINHTPDKLSEILNSMVYNKTESIETAHRQKNGESFPVEVRIRTFGPKKKPFLLSLARDISERKQADDELKQKMKQLEIFNKAAVGRELKMLELKKEINEYLVKSGAKPKYEIL